MPSPSYPHVSRWLPFPSPSCPHRHDVISRNSFHIPTHSQSLSRLSLSPIAPLPPLSLPFRSLFLYNHRIRIRAPLWPHRRRDRQPRGHEHALLACRVPGAPLARLEVRRACRGLLTSRHTNPPPLPCPRCAFGPPGRSACLPSPVTSTLSSTPPPPPPPPPPPSPLQHTSTTKSFATPCPAGPAAPPSPTAALSLSPARAAARRRRMWPIRGRRRRGGRRDRQGWQARRKTRFTTRLGSCEEKRCGSGGGAASSRCRLAIEIFLLRSTFKIFTVIQGSEPEKEPLVPAIPSGPGVWVWSRGEISNLWARNSYRLQATGSRDPEIRDPVQVQKHRRQEIKSWVLTCSLAHHHGRLLCTGTN